jgi:alpha-galactosidase
MPTIAFIGAGSTVFARNLLGDILLFPELARSRFRLHDIDPERLRTSERMAHKLAQGLGAAPAIEATTDRRRALEGADFVITMFQVGGYRPATVTDFEIPKKYGLRQTIADTLGIGGIMRGLRTIPVLLDICADMHQLCPDALLINYVNPMAMLCWAVERATPIKSVGLCHSVQHTAEMLANHAGVPVADVSYLCAGINHMAFYLRFEQVCPDGSRVDLYPRLKQLAERGGPNRHNLVRYEMLKRLGYFVTESSEHFAEYVPWFIKPDRPELIERFNIPLDEYPRRCEAQIAEWNQMRDSFEGDAPLAHEPSYEYAAGIIHSLTTGQPRVVYGNVRNDHLIDNLPQDCCVEVPCLVDRAGLQPTRVGPLPPHLAGLIQTNVNVQSLTVEAALTGNRQHVYHAAMLDPHTAAQLTLDEIWALVDELLEAHSEYVKV